MKSNDLGKNMAATRLCLLLPVIAEINLFDTT